MCVCLSSDEMRGLDPLRALDIFIMAESATAAPHLKTATGETASHPNGSVQEGTEQICLLVKSTRLHTRTQTPTNTNIAVQRLRKQSTVLLFLFFFKCIVIKHVFLTLLLLLELLRYGHHSKFDTSVEIPCSVSV